MEEAHGNLKKICKEWRNGRFPPSTYIWNKNESLFRLWRYEEPCAKDDVYYYHPFRSISTEIRRYWNEWEISKWGRIAETIKYAVDLQETLQEVL